MANTGTFEDVRKAYFKAQQTQLVETSTLKYTADDFEMAAVCKAASLSYPTEISSAWRKYFSAKGLSNVYSKNLSDLWYEWLGTKGFTQTSLRDRQRAFFAAGTVNL